MNLAVRHPDAFRSSDTMAAAVLTGAGRCEIRSVQPPVPGPGEIRVKLEGCGVCASNLGPWAGPEWMTFPTRPGDLGHEGWGRIDALGAGVEGFEIGDRVGALFYSSYAQYDVGPAANVVKLPPELAEQPVPLEPLACAINIFRRSGIERGQKTAIVGAGFLGLLLVQLAKAEGCEVTVLSRRPTSLEAAKRLGADHVVQAEDPGDAANVEQGSFGCVIEATGKQQPLDLASALVAERGRLVIAGYHQDGPRIVNMQSWNWRGIDVINAHERDPQVYLAAMREAVDLLADGTLDVESLITHVYPLHRLGEALDATRDRPEGFIKAIVEIE